MKLSRGDVVLVSFPFSSGLAAKRRPAVVVQADFNNVQLANTIVVMITTTTRRTHRAQTQLLVDPSSEDGRSSGLLHPSAITCENLLTIAQDRVARKIGQLSPALVVTLNSCLRAALALD